MRRFCLLFLFVGVAMSANAQQAQASPDHTQWVAQALTRMQTIKAGMTRRDLLTVFTTEGGLSTRLRRTYVSRDCPYFKVDVEFNPVGRVNPTEDGDIIVKISRPYLQFSIAD